MALTESEKNELKKDILNSIKSESQSVDELAEVTSLDNIKSLPAMRGQEVVLAPVALLRKPAEDAAAVANAAATKADNAATGATNAAQTATNAAGTANRSAETANAAAGTATAAAKKAEDAAAAVDGSLVGGMTAVPDEKNDTVKLTILGRNGQAITSTDIPGGTGSGGNTYNVTEEVPLENGYYTLETAIAAVNVKYRYKGRCITYEAAQGRWETKQFTGTSVESWEQAASWEDFGGAGTLKSLTVNGEQKVPDAEGNVSLTIDKVEVDESLDASSTNPVENRAVTAKIEELDANTVFGASAELSDDETIVRLTLTNKSGAEITSVDLPAGSGGGGDGGSTTRIVLGALVDNPTVKEGGSVKLTWTYDHQYSSGDEKGESTGQKAAVTIQVKRGATTTYSESVRDVSKGTYTLDLTKYLLLGTSDIYVIAETTDPTTGKAQKKQAYVSVKSVTLSLTSSYNIATGITRGGLGAEDTATIPYAVTGTGTKTVTLYVDGVQKESHSVTRSGTTNGTFGLAISPLSVGRHTVQIVAEMEVDGLTLKSESVYMDLLKRGSSAPFIGTKIVHADGRIITGTGHTVPTIETGRYELCSFDFVAYDPSVTPATVEIWRNGNLSRTVSVPRSVQTYSNRFTEEGTQTLQLKLGSTSYSLTVDVTESGVDVSEASYGLLLKLDAAGRSNGESDPGVWESGNVKTTFENVDWSSSGWTGEALKLTNGAKATIGYKPFATDVKSTGLTIELTMKVSNVTDRSAAVVSCISGGKGLLVTTQEAGFRTGQTVTYTNEDDELVTRDVKPPPTTPTAV